MQTQVLLENMSGKKNFIGNPVKAVGYNSHNTNKRNNTIVIFTTNFTGRIWLEGSLKEEPKDDLDWFTIPLTDETPYLEYYNIGYTKNKKENSYHNIYGSYTWFRVKMDRDYLNIEESSFVPFDYKSDRYIMDANVDVNQGFSHSNYPQSNLNPIYDPIYYNGVKMDYSLAYDKQIILQKLGNIEKIMLCY